MRKRVWAALIGAGLCLLGAGMGSRDEPLLLQLQAAGGILSLAIGCVATTEVRRLVSERT